ncbi:hypothetical protein [Microbacterium sp. 2FI]|uniref:hypothetical protein n=1 Tax=Microbacterium sp. 2FI TaxID=2502193 RepID=UPI0010F6F599|nr:hypothetical protein [Microbacterium sp. 2FI]
MFHTTTAPRYAPAILAVVVLVGIGSLTACQTGAARDRSGAQSTRPTVQTAPIPAEYTGMQADRIAEAIEREAARARELSERFSGVPADRIEQQLASDTTP